jgi:hypothetical protein
MRKLLFGLAALFAIAGTNQATADTLVDTIGSDTFVLGGYDISNRPGVHQSIALEFSTGSDPLVEDILAYIGHPGGPASGMTLGLMTDSSGVPSGAFVTGDFVHLAPIGPVSLTSLNWAVTPGSTYWLVAISDQDSFQAWQDSLTAANNWTFNETGDGTSWLNPRVDGPPEARITGASVTPLPAALPLFATGLGAMGLFGWRRKRKNTAAIAA